MHHRIKITFIILNIFLANYIVAQNKVAITIDDVPNTLLFEKESYQSKLLKRIDSLQIPVAIFINEGLVFKTDSTSINVTLLEKWIKNEYITLGNHSFTHARYSTSDIKNYKKEILKGETITRELAKKYNKPLIHFRFPYNDLGKDSLQKAKIKQFLAEHKYNITPFTIESSDWMYNYVYEYYLQNNQHLKAQKIGEQYVEKTLDFFDFFEELSNEKYGRNINQIYLCHDNKLNTDFLPLLIKKLKTKNYQFISLGKALKDKVYQNSNNYFKKWGISWFYRWMTDKSERKAMFQKEPSTKEIYELYESLKQE